MSDFVERRGWIQHVLRNRPDLTADQKLVLIALIDRANDDDVCWPSHARIGADVSRAPRHVGRVLRSLAALGLISVQRKEDWRSNRYVLQGDAIVGHRTNGPVPPPGSRVSSVGHRTNGPRGSDRRSGGGGLLVGGDRTVGPTNQNKEPLQEPNQEPVHTSARSGVGGEREPPPAAPFELSSAERERRERQARDAVARLLASARALGEESAESLADAEDDFEKRHGMSVAAAALAADRAGRSTTSGPLASDLEAVLVELRETGT